MSNIPQLAHAGDNNTASPGFAFLAHSSTASLSDSVNIMLVNPCFLTVSAICSAVWPSKTRHLTLSPKASAQSSNETFLSYHPAIRIVGLDIASIALIDASVFVPFESL